MRFFILGSSGMAGHQIAMYLQEQGHEVLGYSLTTSPLFPAVAGDVCDKDRLAAMITEGKYDSVINCVGLLNQFAEEKKDLAVYLNSYLPHFLADATADTATQVIHMSTDCVFSGKTGGYTEDSFRDGETFYDRTKALGELEDGKNITLRNSIVGPDINVNGIGLLNWFMKQQGTIKGFTKAMWTGLTTLELAKAMECAAKEKAHGLYNMVYKESISKYDLLGLFNHYLRNDEIEIIPYEDFAADKSLVRTRFDFNYIIPDYEKMVADMAQWVKNHREIYPHYNVAE